MSSGLSPDLWIKHLLETDQGEAFITAGGALIRVVETRNQVAHLELGSERGFRDVGSNANLLVRADANHDRITGMPQLSNIAVSVTPVTSVSRVASK